MKKLLALTLATLFILPFCIGCGNGTNGKNEATTAATETGNGEYDKQGYLNDDLPDNLNFDTTITTLMWSDHTMLEFYVEETTGNNIESAIYQRNSVVQSRLGVKLAYVEEPGHGGSKESKFMSKIDADVQSGDNLYDVYASYSQTAPRLSLKGACANLLTTEYFDVEKPWWPKTLTEQCTINDKLYFASGDISTNLLWMMTGNFYNKKMYESYKSDEKYQKTPEEYVKDNEWTLDLLFSMTKEYYTDTDGDLKKSTGDTYGLFLCDFNVDAFQTAGGIVAIEKSNEGLLQIADSYISEAAGTLCQKVGEYLKTNGVYLSTSVNDRSVFFNQQATFIIDRCFIVAGKDNSKGGTGDDKIDFSFGLAPVPKASADQENFMTNVGHPFTMYALAGSGTHIDAASATLECLASESYRKVTPEVFESTLKIRYSDGDDSSKMYDIIRANVIFDLGRLYSPSFDSRTSTEFKNCALNSPTSFHTNIKKYLSVMNRQLQTVSNAYND